MNIKKHIPNFITLLNLFCGCLAVIFAVKNQLEIAAFFVFLGIFFDFFDGLAARLLKVQSELGLQLDSLADMVTSGVVPGIFMYQLFNRSLDIHEKVNDGHSWSDSWHWFQNEVQLLPLFGLLIALASAYRLAKFNIDENQTSSFIGLPTPANTLLIISLPLILMYQGSEIVDAIILNKWFLVGMTLVSSYLLNANIPLFALKFKDWSFKNNAVKYIFLAICIALLLFLHFLAIPIIILLYVVLSIIKK
ncbi:CDP-alcohol phosphatidyltransferase family protein [Kordia sp. YSTF-M3]|uniref:CDP-alcohol phosphatidyltransferase family protein n=1 Tax=Kordia aestuariivivens TaxID=2759037 RepID=A0ABR7Q980_9FLAO|nr:CDP-alcohol phosphatidyltransferase family protein [Kordia aestuariivivens]MBC8755111.1 CDP-alcohol phosphatidyltransferase family protein [Kordia aestuariivivens]